jgi:hypothetical protein
MEVARVEGLVVSCSCDSHLVVVSGVRRPVYPNGPGLDRLGPVQIQGNKEEAWH